MPDRKQVPGKFVWFQLASSDSKRAQAFYSDVLGWKAVRFPFGGATYEMIFADETPDTMVGDYVAAVGISHWIGSVSVEDVDAAATAALANGGNVLEAPHDVPDIDVDAAVDRAQKLGARIRRPAEDMAGIGRLCVIEDPTGAVLAVMKPSPRQAARTPPPTPDVSQQTGQATGPDFFVRLSSWRPGSPGVLTLSTQEHNRPLSNQMGSSLGVTRAVR